MYMKKAFSMYVLSGLLFFSFCAQPAQAQPPIKQMLKTLGKRCEKKIATVSSKLQTVLSRRAAQTKMQTAARQPFVFSSLEDVSAYYARLRHLPPFPLPQADTELYRGMTLDASGKQLRHIFKYGLEVSKTHSINFAAYDGRQYPDYQKAIYASPDISLAASFAVNDTRYDKHIPVIIHLKRVSDTRIVSIPHDIPPSWIYRISALLTIKGKSMWGEIRLDENGNFVFLPYPKKK